MSSSGTESQLLDGWTEDDSMDRISKITFTGTEGEAEVADPSDKAVQRVHGERSEVATGQQKTVYTMVTGHSLTTGQEQKVKSMIDSGNTL